MNISEILNCFPKSENSSLTDAQKREIAEMLARYLGSYEFARAVRDALNTWGING